MRLFKKDAPSANPFQPPTVSHIHHHDSKKAELVLAWALVVGAGIVITWGILVYLFDAAGAYKPQRTAAQTILYGGGLYAIGLVLQHWIRQGLLEKYEHEEAMAEQRTQQLRYQQLLTGSAIADSRTTGDRQRLATLIYMIMLDAYDHVAKSGPYRGSWRPWSRRPAGERILVTLGETAPVGQEFGAKVRPFLETQEVIKNDQINLDQYPSIADVQRLLHQPILLQTGPPTPPENGGDNWTIIE